MADMPKVQYQEMAPEDGMHVLFSNGTASHEMANFWTLQITIKKTVADPTVIERGRMTVPHPPPYVHA